MEQRLLNAALEGSVPLLHEILQEDSLVLDRVSFGCFGTSPLHVAASRGHTDFVTEVLRLNPDLAEVVDSSQRLPLHLASAKGHVYIVQMLTEMGSDMCLARDKDGRNPLHLAAMKGKVDVLRVLVQANPYAAQVTMDRGETILHLCVMCDQLESLMELMSTFKNEEFVNAQDGRGNAILHLAVANKHVEVIRYLFANSRVDVNITNARGCTALDILAEIRNDVKDFDISEDELRNAGAKSDKELAQDPWLEKWLEKKRETLMLVASFITAIAFQAGVSPPGGVWQDNLNGHRAGEAIMAYNYPNEFPHYLRVCTIGFIGCLTTTLLLISGLSFKNKAFTGILFVVTWFTVVSIALTYGFAILAVVPRSTTKSITTTTIVVAIIAWCSLMVLIGLLHIVYLVRLIAEAIQSRRLVAKRTQRLS